MADQRPSWVGYLALTHTGSTVSGYLQTALPDGTGSTKSHSAAIEGTTSGNAVTLQTSGFLGMGAVAMTGSKQGDALVLTVPNSTGTLDTLRYTAAQEAAYNDKVGTWQRELGAAHQQRLAAQAAATAQAAAARATATAIAGQQRAVTQANAALGAALPRLATGTAELRTASSFEAELKRATDDFQKMRATDKKLHDDAAKRPFTCAARGTVQADLGTLQANLGSCRLHAAGSTCAHGASRTAPLRFSGVWAQYAQPGKRSVRPL